MAHLKKNVAIDSVVKGTEAGLKKGAKYGLSMLGGVGAVISKFSNRIVEKKVMPYIKKKGILAKGKYEEVMDRSKYKAVRKYRGSKKDMIKKRNSLSQRKKKKKRFKLKK